MSNQLFSQVCCSMYHFFHLDSIPELFDKKFRLPAEIVLNNLQNDLSESLLFFILKINLALLVINPKTNAIPLSTLSLEI